MCIRDRLSTVPNVLNNKKTQIPTALEPLRTSQKFESVESIIISRCSMCHASEPVYPNIHIAPSNVLLETEEQIIQNARGIYLHAGRSNAMPPANVTWMEEDERTLLVQWYEEAL